MTLVNSKPGRRALAVAVALLAAASVRAADPAYYLIDLGQDTSTIALASNGLVLGTTGNHVAIYRDGAWYPAKMPKPGAEAKGVNADGVIAGTAFASPNDTNTAIVWRAHGKPVAVAPEGVVDSVCYAINDAGVAACWATPGPGSTYFGYTWQAGGVITRLEPPAGAHVFTPHAINASGQMAGGADFDGDLVEEPALRNVDGSFVRLGTLGGGPAYVRALNGHGHVVGQTKAPQRAFFHDGNAMIDLGTLGGPAASALAINDDDVIVGSAEDAGFHARAFVWRDGTMTDLATVTLNATGWKLLEAWGIGNDGVIVGNGGLRGVEHGFMLVPLAR